MIYKDFIIWDEYFIFIYFRSHLIVDFVVSMSGTPSCYPNYNFLSSFSSSSHSPFIPVNQLQPSYIFWSYLRWPVKVTLLIYNLLTPLLFFLCKVQCSNFSSSCFLSLVRSQVFLLRRCLSDSTHMLFNIFILFSLWKFWPVYLIIFYIHNLFTLIW